MSDQKTDQSNENCKIPNTITRNRLFWRFTILILGRKGCELMNVKIAYFYWLESLWTSLPNIYMLIWKLYQWISFHLCCSLLFADFDFSSRISFSELSIASCAFETVFALFLQNFVVYLQILMQILRNMVHFTSVSLFWICTLILYPINGFSWAFHLFSMWLLQHHRLYIPKHSKYIIGITDLIHLIEWICYFQQLLEGMVCRVKRRIGKVFVLSGNGKIWLFV